MFLPLKQWKLVYPTIKELDPLAEKLENSPKDGYITQDIPVAGKDSPNHCCNQGPPVTVDLDDGNVLRAIGDVSFLITAVNLTL